LSPGRARRPDASGARRYLPHTLIATAVVTILPAMAVRAIIPTGSMVLMIASVPLAVALSVGAASAGSAIWQRHAGSRDLVFADLMLWGWFRRMRAERRLNEARELLGLNGGESERLSRDRRVEALKRLSGLLEARDAYTHGHTRRVTRHAERIARAMRLSPADVAKVRTAATLHDVGKVHTPREILNKPGPLADEEFAVIRRHPVDGADMLSEFGDEITAMVRHHHERLDGTGYPDGLAGDEIPLGARIIAVADTFDAMTSGRPYNGACQHKQALDVLSKQTGAQLDAGSVSAFLRYYSGRRLVAWSALVTTAPQRFAAWLGSSTPGLGAGAASLAQAVPTVGVAVVLAASPGPTAGAGSRETGSARGAQTASLPSKGVSAGRLATIARGSRWSARGAPVGQARSSVRKAPRDSAPTTSPSRPGAPHRAVTTASPKPSPASGAEPGPNHGSGSGSSPAPPARDRSPEVELVPAQTIELPAVKSPAAGQTPVNVPDVKAPAVQTPEVAVPAVQTPGVKVPPVAVPPVEPPSVDPTGGALPGVALPG
jgi:putative nucleotidyltransferase with HDIG domain